MSVNVKSRDSNTLSSNHCPKICFILQSIYFIEIRHFIFFSIFTFDDVQLTLRDLSPVHSVLLLVAGEDDENAQTQFSRLLGGALAKVQWGQLFFERSKIKMVNGNICTLYKQHLEKV